MSTPVEQVIAEAAQDKINTALGLLSYEVTNKIQHTAEELGCSAAWVRRLLVIKMVNGTCEGESGDDVMEYATDEVARKITKQMLQAMDRYAKQGKEIAQ